MKLSGVGRCPSHFGVNYELSTEHQLILDAIAEGVCGVDAEGNVTFCNDALLQTTGYFREEVVGKNAHAVLHHSRPDKSPYPSDECALRNAVLRGEPAHLVGEFLWRKDGTCFPVEYCGRPLRQPGSRTCYVSTIRDITDIEAAKEAFRRNEEQYRRILASMPDVAWTSDANGETRYVSPKVQALLGFSNKEFYSGGTHLWLNQIHPEDFGRVSQRYAGLFEKELAFDEEYRIRRKDGAWIWVRDRATRPHKENGVLCADGFLTDITERKQAEADLRSKTAFWEAQANSTIDGLLVVDRSGQRLMANERLAELLQIPAELMADPDDWKMLEYAVTLIKDAESFREKVDYLYRNPSATSRDEIELKNGVILDRYSAPVVDKNGTCYGRMWTFRDITERKRNEQAQYNEHPDVAFGLLSKIPRMEPVAWMIRHQDRPVSDGDGVEAGEMKTGAAILRLILEYEQLIHRGISRTESAHQLAMKNREFSPQFFEALVTLDPNAEQSEIQNCKIDDLTPGMIIQQEVRSCAGALLISRGQEVTSTVIFKLKNFNSRRAIAGTVVVSMPKTTLAFGKGAS